MASTADGRAGDGARDRPRGRRRAAVPGLAVAPAVGRRAARAVAGHPPARLTRVTGLTAALWHVGEATGIYHVRIPCYTGDCDANARQLRADARRATVARREQASTSPASLTPAGALGRRRHRRRCWARPSRIGTSRLLGGGRASPWPWPWPVRVVAHRAVTQQSCPGVTLLVVRPFAPASACASDGPADGRAAAGGRDRPGRPGQHHPLQPGPGSAGAPGARNRRPRCHPGPAAETSMQA